MKFRYSVTLSAFLLAVFLPVSGLTQSDLAECSANSSPLQTGTDPQSPMYKLGGNPYRELDLPVSIQSAIYDAKLEHYKAQLAIIDQALLQHEVDKRAKAAGKSPEEMARSLFESNIPTSKAVEEFYASNKDRIKSPLAAVEEQLIAVMIQRDIRERQLEMLQEIKEKQGFEIMIPKPVAPHVDLAVDGFPRKGIKEAKVTIVEFADYQCPHCKNAAAVLRSLAKRYSNELAVVYVDFPVNPSGISRTVAKGGACADQQGQFWSYHDLAFESQSTLDQKSPGKIAKSIGLDVEKFEACLESPYPDSQVVKGENEANRLGLTGTPTLFLNGRRLHLHDIETELPAEIEKLLAKLG